MEARLSRNVVVLLLIVSLTATLLTSSASPVSGDKVKLDLYYESLCPYCENFIVNYLSMIFQNGLISIIDLKLSPYGNAKLLSNGTIVCQHGEWECRLNYIEACAIHVWPVASDHFRFIKCVASFTCKEEYGEWELCFGKLKLDPKPVSDCITSGLGHKLELKYAEEISALKPPHIGVPWVVVDGKPLDDYRDFMSFICKAYKGSSVPRACRGLSLLTTTPNYSVKPFNHVCYNEDHNAKRKLSKVTKMHLLA